MRLSIVLVAAVVCGAACGGGGSAAHDMAKAGHDLASGDLAAPGVGCDAYVKCLNGCPQSGPQHDSCFTSCMGQVSMSGLQLFDDILRCAQAACDAAPDTTPDMGSPCRYDPTTNAFDDPDACGACQSQQLTMGTCTDQQNACAADTAGE